MAIAAAASRRSTSVPARADLRMNTVSSGVLDIIGLKIASGAIIVDGTESIGQAGGDDLMNYFAYDRRSNFGSLKTRGYHRRSGKRRFETHPGFRGSWRHSTDASSPR